MRYSSTHQVFMSDKLGGSRKLRSYRLRITASINSLFVYKDIQGSFEELLGGKVILGSQQPYTPVFRVLEALGIFELVILESSDLQVLSKTLGNLIIRNAGLEVEWLETSIDDKICSRFIFK